jgi:capping protein beta
MLTRYRYYEGGISSVYFWDIDEGFAGCVLLKKGIIHFSSSFYGYHAIY